MNLDETKRKQVKAWIEEGLKIADIQKRLETEWGLRQTYLEVRLLVDDLKLVPKDPAPLPPPPKLPPAPAPGAEDNFPPSKVSVSVDQLTRAGAMASGKVKFSDGKTADWLLDQMGRLSLLAAEKGYKPSPADLQDFQLALQTELQRLG
ncbi:MAG: hypothetical protein ABSA47_18580 [Verrucomicrobiota bacterium]|jgi:hypothetical protein